MSIRTANITALIQTTTNLPSPAAPLTFVGVARLNAAPIGYSSLFSLEGQLSNASDYVSLGLLASGNVAFDVQPLSGYADLGPGPAAGRWFDWFVQVDTAPATDVWRAGWRYHGTGGAWATGTRGVTLSWTPAVHTIGNNTWAESGNVSFGRTLAWTATLSLAEIEQQALQVGPVRRAGLQRFALLRGVGDARDYSGNGYNYSTSGGVDTDTEPPLPWAVQPRAWFVAWGAAGAPASQNVTGAAARATGRAPAATAVQGGVVVQSTAARSRAQARAAAVSAGPVLIAGAPARGQGRGRAAVAFPADVLPDGALTNNPANPLISNGPETYDALKAGPRHVIKFGPGDYRMIYEAIADDGLTTTVAAYATSADGTTWTKQGVVLSASEAWEGPEVAPTTWFWDAAISKYVLYYHGGGNSVPRKIGRATADSPAGPWTKYAGNPVLSPGPSGSYDYGATGDCKVIKIGPIYHMWYAGEDGVGGYTKIHHATSSDGIAWTKDAANPIFSGAASGWDSGDTQSPSVVYDALRGLYHLWYVGDNGDAANEAIGYAWSTDGVTWTRGANNPVLTKPGTANVYIGDTTDAYKDGATYRVLYGYFDFNGAAKRQIREATVTVAAEVQTVTVVAARSRARAAAGSVSAGAVTVAAVTVCSGGRGLGAVVSAGAALVASAPARTTGRAVAAIVSAGPVVLTAAAARSSGRAPAVTVAAGAVVLVSIPARAGSRAQVAAVNAGPVTFVGVSTRAAGRALATLVLAGGQAVQGASARGTGRAVAGTLSAGAVTVLGAAARGAGRALPATLSSGAILQGVAVRGRAQATAANVTAGPVVIVAVVAVSRGRALAGSVAAGAAPGQNVTGVAAVSRGRALAGSVVAGLVTVQAAAARGAGTGCAAVLTPGPVTVVAVAAHSRSRAVAAVILEGNAQYIGGGAAVTVAQAFAALLWAVPASRIYRVEFEDRMYRVEFEDRTYAVQGE